MIRSSQSSKSNLQYLFYLTLVFTAYLIVAKFSLSTYSIGQIIPALWPPTGIAIAAVVLGGRPMAAPIFLASLIAQLHKGSPAPLSFVIAVINSFEALFAAAVLGRIKNFDWTFGDIRHVIKFLMGVVFGSTFIAAAIATTSLILMHYVEPQNIFSFALSWWLGSSFGALVTLPFLLIWAKSDSGFAIPRQNYEFYALIGLTLVTCSYLFLNLEIAAAIHPQALRRLYVLFPFIVWAALRFGAAGISAVIFIIGTFAFYRATQQVAPLPSSSSQPESLLAIEIFTGISSLTGLIMAAIATQSKRSENRFRSIFETAGTPMAKVDAEGRFILVNQYFCDLTGYSRDELLGMTFPEITHPDDITHEADLFGRLRDKEIKKINLEKRYIRKDGTIIWISLDGTMIPAENFTTPKFMAVVHDITLRKMAEATSQKAQQDAMAANQAKSAFLASMSHEIRTPLGVIQGFSEILKESDLPNDIRSEFTETLYRNAIELGKLIDDVLDLSKIEAGRLEIVRETMSLEALFDDIRETFVFQAHAKGLGLHLEIKPDVPRQIFSDQKRLRQILVNIVNNAIKYTEKGCIKIAADLKTAPADGKGFLTISVADSGSGIAAEDIPKLFQPFTQIKKKSGQNTRGTGLGLLLSRTLAKLLGGDVQLHETSISQGSTFVITIDPGPTKQPKVSGPLEANEEAVTTRSDQEKLLAGLRVLMAEDTPDQAMLIRYMLTDLGAVVDSVENGKIAIDKAISNSYDVILMDMQMPILDGYEASKKLRDVGYKKPIIALTAQAMSGDAQKCRDAGCSDHIAKPFSQQILREKIISSISK